MSPFRRKQTFCKCVNKGADKQKFHMLNLIIVNRKVILTSMLHFMLQASFDDKIHEIMIFKNANNNRADQLVHLYILHICCLILPSIIFQYLMTLYIGFYCVQFLKSNGQLKDEGITYAKVKYCSRLVVSIHLQVYLDSTKSLQEIACWLQGSNSEMLAWKQPNKPTFRA